MLQVQIMKKAMHVLGDRCWYRQCIHSSKRAKRLRVRVDAARPPNLAWNVQGIKSNSRESRASFPIELPCFFLFLFSTACHRSLEALEAFCVISGKCFFTATKLAVIKLSTAICVEQTDVSSVKTFHLSLVTIRSRRQTHCNGFLHCHLCPTNA